MLTVQLNLNINKNTNNKKEHKLTCAHEVLLLTLANWVLHWLYSERIKMACFPKFGRVSQNPPFLPRCMRRSTGCARCRQLDSSHALNTFQTNDFHVECGSQSVEGVQHSQLRTSVNILLVAW